jgi:hypothetical protein
MLFLYVLPIITWFCLRKVFVVLLLIGAVTQLFVSMSKQCWKVLNWNIRGLNDKKKWTLIFDKIKESGCHVICFQGTKRETLNIAYIRKFCLRIFDSFAFQPSVGRSGGIHTVWDSSCFNGVCVFQNNFALSVKFQST